MAGTVKKLRESPYIEGAEYVQLVEWTGDNSYEAGGEAFSLIEAGFGKEAVFKYANTCWIKNLSEQAVYQPTGAWFDGTKVHIVDNATGKELAGTKDVSKVTILFEIHCTAN
jgi:hypothetical protein